MPPAPPPPPNKPTNLILESRDSNALKVRWDSVSNATNYEIEVSSIGQIPLPFPATIPQDIENLLPLASNRVYNIRVRALNISGTSDFSDVLFAVTLPPKPLPPSGTSSMIEVNLMLAWEVQLSTNVDVSHPLFIEIKREDSDQIIGTNLSLKGKLSDQPPTGENSYFMRLVSQISSISPSLRNESNWSDKVTIRKDVFAKLEIPRIKENQQIRVSLLNRNYFYL
jgi:hypothetical protein